MRTRAPPLICSTLPLRAVTSLTVVSSLCCGAKLPLIVGTNAIT
ncbi:MAG: hypothetical protein QM723_36925 [Myxococcaceae bacterium]